MNPIKFILLAFLIIPFLEIYLLLQIGGFVGILPTIFLVVSTAMIGVGLLKQQGLATWQSFQTNISRGELPAIEIIEGALLLVGGALLLTPGFFTDMAGFCCLMPVMRKKIALYILEKKLMTSSNSYNKKTDQENIIEGEFKKEK